MTERARSLPQVTRSSHGYQLIIDGRPTVLLGGQLHNSASSRSLPELFAKVRRLQATFVIGSASWAMLEPREGEFDLTDVDRQLELAHEHGLRLVLLWFGAYKNASSTYADVGACRLRSLPRTQLRRSGREAFSYDGAMAKPVLSVFSPHCSTPIEPHSPC